jgi:arginyl-tRNA synthetase
VALQTSAHTALNPHDFATALATVLTAHPWISAATVTGPGFLNLRLSPTTLRDIILAASRLPVDSPLSCEASHDKGSPLPARWAAASGRSADLAVWAVDSVENPLYRVQYAYSRARAMLRTAAELGITTERALDTVDFSLLAHDLIRLLGEHGWREPNHSARYLESLADAYYEFAAAHRILPFGDAPVTDEHRACLLVCQATAHTLSAGLAALGVTAPERM